MNKKLEETRKVWNELYDSLTKEHLFNLLMECISQRELLIDSLKEIESLTRNPREYEPSYYTINHIARIALEIRKELK